MVWLPGASVPIWCGYQGLLCQLLDCAGCSHRAHALAHTIHCCVHRIVPEDGYISAASGALRGYELSVTRALGHKHMSHHGVICEPSVVRRELPRSGGCVVAASDGVWDVLSAHEAVSRVLEAADDGEGADHIAQALVEEAVELAESGPGGESDNASACVVLLG